MKKEYGKKIGGSVIVGLVLAVVLVMLVGFGSKPDVAEEPLPSASPKIVLSSSQAEATPSPKPSAKASPSPKAKSTPKVELAESVEKEEQEPVLAAKSSPEQAAPSSSKAPAATATPAAIVVESTPQPAPTVTPSRKKRCGWWMFLPPHSKFGWTSRATGRTGPTSPATGYTAATAAARHSPPPAMWTPISGLPLITVKTTVATL